MVQKRLLWRKSIDKQMFIDQILFWSAITYQLSISHFIPKLCRWNCKILSYTPVLNHSSLVALMKFLFDLLLQHRNAWGIHFRIWSLLVMYFLTYLPIIDKKFWISLNTLYMYICLCLHFVSTGKINRKNSFICFIWKRHQISKNVGAPTNTQTKKVITTFRFIISD